VEELHAVRLTHIEFLDTDEVRYRFPWLGDRVIAAKWDPVAGRVDSNALVHRYAVSAKNTAILLGVQDCSIQVEQGRVSGVRTPQGLISAPRVLIANGVNAMATAQTAGVELPVVLKPRQSFTTMWRHELFPPDGPLVIGEASFPHVRPESGTGAMFGWEYAWKAKGTPLHDALIDPLPPDGLKDPRFPSLTLALLARQFKHQPGEGFASSQYLRGVRHNIGYYVYRGPDAAYQIDSEGQRHPYESERAIIGQHPQMQGLYLSVAHSGHGIMTSPAAGEIAARVILGHPLGHSSFSDFAPNVPWVRHDISVL
jgi:glycine/D-amino acid oxidase-like deaminating enzyme